MLKSVVGDNYLKVIDKPVCDSAEYGNWVNIAKILAMIFGSKSILYK